MNDVILKTIDLTKRFGGLAAVDKVSIEVIEGEILGILGPNGAGKTTLFNILSGYFRPTEGTFTYKGRDITKLSSEKVASLGIVRTYQIVRLFDKLTVYENLLIPCLSPRMSAKLKDKKSRENYIENLAEEVGISEFLDSHTEGLSHGVRKLVEFGRALANDPDVLLLDEPFSGLNPVEVEPLANVIRNFHKKGNTILIIEHKLREFMKLVERVIAMDRGKIIASGSVKEISENPLVVEAYLGKGASRFVGA